MYFICLVIAVVFMAICNVYDITLTVKGLMAGLAVEGFTWLIGSNPTKAQLYMRDILIDVMCVAPTLIALGLHNLPVAYGALVSPVICGVKHIQGGLEWKRLGA